MSVRYGISLILEPSFTAGLHRARQVICSQYGCWAAEMHAVHLPLTGYFPCPEAVAPSVVAGLERAAAEFRSRSSLAFLARRGLAAAAGDRGSIYLEFAEAGNPSPKVEGVSRAQTEFLDQLRTGVAAALAQSSLTAETASALRFGLLLFAGLPAPVFQSAVRFAEGVVDGVGLATHASLAELALFRYESAAAGEDWSNGGWANDLTWQIVASFPLS